MALITVKQRELDISDEVRAAVLLLSNYGALLTHDTGHIKSAPTWIFTLPQFNNAQIAMRMNKIKLSLYLRNKALNGELLEPLISNLTVIEERFPHPKKGAPSSLQSSEHAPFLRPTDQNQLLRIRPHTGMLRQIIDLYLTRSISFEPSVEPTLAFEEATHGGSGTRQSRVVVAEELLAQLDRNAAIGRTGEQIALEDERQRLLQCGCFEPERYLELVAISDVGCGYDIASRWPGEERCIEVKSSTNTASPFFLTANERQTLTKLGFSAWLYRVEVTAESSGRVIQRIRNPIARISNKNMIPVVWRINADAVAENEN